MKPNTTYQVSIEVHPDLVAIRIEPVQGLHDHRVRRWHVRRIAGTTMTITWRATDWTTIPTSRSPRPHWTEEPANVYLVVNSDAHSRP